MDILIVGVSVRGLVESAVRSGLEHRIVAVDHFGDFDLQLLCKGRSIKRDLGLPYDVRHLTAACRDLTFDALVYGANLENYPSALEAIRCGRPVLGNGESVLSSVRDPGRFFNALDHCGIPAPKTSLSPDVLDLEPGIVWLRKPVRSGGGHGIAFHASGARLEQGFFLQEYLDGLPCGAVFVADGRECCLLGISEQLIGQKEFGVGGFRYCGSILGPVVQERARWSALIEDVRRMTRSMTRAFHLVGLNGLDFILRGDAIHPIEINPRYTASMELVERAYGINIFDAHLAACQGKLPAFDLSAQSEAGFFGKAVLFATDSLVFHDPHGWFERGVRDLPFDKERIETGKPVCTVFSREGARAECYAGLIRAAIEVRQTAIQDPCSGERTK